jgi:GNAT superfamily N-acetyltransferase
LGEVNRHESTRSMTEITIRAAQETDREAVAMILAQAFPALYDSTFGRLGEARQARLLHALYRDGLLSLETTRIAVHHHEAVGVCILHTGKDIGRGSLDDFWRSLRSELGWFRAIRALIGGLTTNAFLNSRIPRAADLVYIEALAVRSDKQGKGIGTALLHDAEIWTRDAKRTRLALHVLVRNEGARRLYERHGYVQWHTAPQRWHIPENRRSAWAALLMVRGLG